MEVILRNWLIAYGGNLKKSAYFMEVILKIMEVILRFMEVILKLFLLKPYLT